MSPIRLFAGYDARESIGFAVFCDSVIRNASRPVSITPLASQGLPQGSNAFTLSRFLVPWLCGYKGHAIFMDASDMLMLGDIAELDALFNTQCSAQVVKHPDYQTRNPVKYVGTPMECENRDYPKKNHASVMLINCEAREWWECNPYQVAKMPVVERLQLEWAGTIGELPPAWNVLCDEGQSMDGAKVLHWTAGIPAFDHYRDAPGAEHWHAARQRMESGQ